MELERLEDRRLLAADVYMPPRFHEIQTDQFLSGPAVGAPLGIALDYVRANAGDFGLTAGDLGDENIVVTDQFTDASTGVTHIYLRQKLNDLEIAFANMNVNIARNGEVISAGSSFIPLPDPSSVASQPSVTPNEAYIDFAQELELTLAEDPEVLISEDTPAQTTTISGGGLASQDVVVELQYIPTEDGLELSWALDVAVIEQGAWYDAIVSADDGEVIQARDRVRALASYEVLPLPTRSPDEGSRTIVVEPHDPIASPFGWHDSNGLPGADFFDTRGNNVIAQEDRDGTGGINLILTAVQRPSGGPGLDFRAPFDLSQAPSAYTDASVTQLFYLTNVAHDLTYRYGFDELAGNFQALNYTGLGQGGDAIIAYAQSQGDIQATSNAAFFPTPEGQPGFLVVDEFELDFTTTPAGPYSPRRDASFVADVIFHEFAHGMTDRLVGGASNVLALTQLQPVALAEGWSDYYALAFLQDANDQKFDSFAIGDYLNGPSPAIPGAGFRRFPYSFDMTVNPLTYVVLNDGPAANVPHDGGEIFASALWDMHWLLIDKYGFDSDLYDGSGGNNLAIQLVTDALKLVPAEPSFIDVRDSILSADLIRNQGVNHEQIWEAFARRGIGLSALADRTGAVVPASNSEDVREAFDVPQPISTVTGRVFGDLNGNGVRDNFETGLSGVEVFVDLNNSGRLDPLEPRTVTDELGNYTFDFLVPGQFDIAIVVGNDLSQTFPALGTSQAVTVTSAGDITDADFGLRSGEGQITGVKFHDLNGDGRREICEIIPGSIQPPCEEDPGIPGVWIYVDYDNDGRFDIGEPSAITGRGGLTSRFDGEYTLNVDREGSFFVREVMTPGWEQTFPGGAAQAHRVTVTEGSLNVTLDFGNTSNLDFGDAPDSYRTSLESGGPVYPIIDGFHLGSSVDADLDGIPSPGADGDDDDQLTSDEDGVVFTSVLSPGSTGSIDITAFSGSYSAGRVNAWIDFNGDGDFADSGEHVVVDTRQSTGTTRYSFPVPEDATSGLTYSRVTYGYHRFKPGDTPTIRDIAGEVEDHQVRVVGSQPQAFDDQFRVDQNSAANSFNVLANDISSRNAPIFIASTSTPNRGGRVSISANGLLLSYTPATGFAGVEVFTYTVQDQAGATDTATVTVTIVPDTPALAVDDSFDVLENTTDNVLDVLDNDLAGQNPPIQIVDVVGSANSLVTVDRRGTTDPDDDVLLYSANPGFAGSDQFSYIIEDDAGIRSTATVTVHNQPTTRNDDIIEYELFTTDLTGNPISAIGVGQPFLLQGNVRDLRADDGDGSPIDRRGIAAAYMDVLYDLSLVSISGSITYGPDYLNSTAGSTAIPGLIDEVGALQTSNIPLGADAALLFSVPMVANAAGVASFVGDPADQREEANPGLPPEHDSLLFQPPSNILLQNMRFTNATLSIVSSGAVPIAVDNTFQVAADPSISNTLDVLANDLDNGNPPLTVVAVTAGDRGGQVVIGSGGANVLYRPAVGFAGVEQFSYTIQNSTGLTSSATVTVQAGVSAKTLRYRLETVPAGPIAVGSEFELRALVDDLRADDGDGNPRDDRGVFAGYIDVLFDSNLVSPISDTQNPLGFQINFATEYRNGIAGDVDTPNIIDEAGAFQTGSLPLGADERLLFTVRLRADATGVASFQADPADILPLHESLHFEPTTTLMLDRIELGSTSITISAAAAEGELTNPTNRLDVNADGNVTPIDPLIVVNYLNRAGAEGESTNMFVDVTGDGHVSPVDALELINYLNRRGVGAAGEGEGEGESQPTGLGVPLVRPTNGTPAATEGAALPTLYDPALSADDAHRTRPRQSVLAEWTRSSDNEIDELISEELAEDILDGWSR